MAVSNDLGKDAPLAELRPPTSLELFLYQLARMAVVGLCRALWGLEVVGRENAPLQGAFVVAPVHRSYIDTLVVAGVSKRRLRYMGKASVWKYRPIGWALSVLGGFPVRRGSADREAMRRGVEALAGGEPLVLFPEGTRRSGAKVEELFDGAAFIAIRAQVPILPVGIAGSDAAYPPGARLPRRAKVRVVIGKPIPPPPLAGGRHVPRQATRELTAKLHEALQDLFEQAQIGAGPKAPHGLSSWSRLSVLGRNKRQRANVSALPAQPDEPAPPA